MSTARPHTQSSWAWPRGLLLMLLFAAPRIGHAEDSPWAAITAQDLQAAHDVLLANHPGPVDPLNPAYRKWLEGGLAEGLRQAQAARNYHDYERAVLAYANGFRDGHTNIYPTVQPAYYEWPGFLPGVAADGSIRVGVSEVGEARVGDLLAGCDGITAEQLFEQRVAPYRWNRDIASERGLRMPLTLLLDAGDDAMRLKTCDIVSGGKQHRLELQWRRVNGTGALELRRKADERTAPQLGLRRLNGVWMISLPSFQYQSDADVARFKAFLGEVEAHAAELRAAPKVIIDVRGNVGGISVWGIAVANQLWGEEVVAAARRRFDHEYTEWRASRTNLAQREDFLRHGIENGMPQEAITDVRESRDAIAKALAEGRPLARQLDEPGSVAPAMPKSAQPPAGRIYLFTDEVCASSCLDFVDVILGLPKVTHVGRTTSADALYIDVNDVTLPSGLSSLSYSMKVDRDKVRGNNVSYTPAIPWPGGLMTDDAVTRFVAGLP